MIVPRSSIADMTFRVAWYISIQLSFDDLNTSVSSHSSATILAADSAYIDAVRKRVNDAVITPSELNSAESELRGILQLTPDADVSKTIYSFSRIRGVQVAAIVGLLLRSSLQSEVS